MGPSDQYPLLGKPLLLPVSCPATPILTPIPVQMIKLNDPTSLLGLLRNCGIPQEQMSWINLIFSWDLGIGRQIKVIINSGSID